MTWRPAFEFRMMGPLRAAPPGGQKALCGPAPPPSVPPPPPCPRVGSGGAGGPADLAPRVCAVGNRVGLLESRFQCAPVLDGLPQCEPLLERLVLDQPPSGVLGSGAGSAGAPLCFQPRRCGTLAEACGDLEGARPVRALPARHGKGHPRTSSVPVASHATWPRLSSQAAAGPRGQRAGRARPPLSGCGPQGGRWQHASTRGRCAPRSG